MSPTGTLISADRPILVTGATGFIGARVVHNLLSRGFRDVRCLARPSSNLGRLQAVLDGHASGGSASFIHGNLLSPHDCRRAAADAAIVYHLAAVRGEKSHAEAFRNSVVTTRNLMEALVAGGRIERLVHVSSFTVYSNRPGGQPGVLDEASPTENEPALREEAYCYAKVKQEELVCSYAREHRIPTVIVRPGWVYGPSNEGIPGRVGIDTFGVFLHLGGNNPIPITFVDNCAEAIVLAGLVKGIDGEVFNIVDDDTPSSRRFLALYKANVKRFRSIYVPKPASYFMCLLWEGFVRWSRGQLPSFLNRRGWRASWKKTRYSNEKIKRLLGWRQPVPTPEALKIHFAACRLKRNHA